MFNTYKIEGKEILIFAPGKSNNNKIKNSLIWEINKFLYEKFELYMFYLEKSHNTKVCFPLLYVSGKYVKFQKLDSQFINQKELNKDEINYYRGIIDPKKRINDDVFEELCSMENVDIEYIATPSLDVVYKSKLAFKSRTSFCSWISSSFPVYISLFGGRELKIVINQSDLQQKIYDIIIRHCIEST